MISFEYLRTAFDRENRQCLAGMCGPEKRKLSDSGILRNDGGAGRYIPWLMLVLQHVEI
jgi:hypothetical protein